MGDRRGKDSNLQPLRPEPCMPNVLSTVERHRPCSVQVTVRSQTTAARLPSASFANFSLMLVFETVFAVHTAAECDGVGSWGPISLAKAASAGSVIVGQSGLSG